MVKIVVSIVVVVIIVRIGIAVLRMLARPPAAPAESGELRKVDLRYRCSVCGVELRVTSAPEEEPAPPRHCLEDMELLERRDV